MERSGAQISLEVKEIIEWRLLLSHSHLLYHILISLKNIILCINMNHSHIENHMRTSLYKIEISILKQLLSKGGVDDFALRGHLAMSGDLVTMRVWGCYGHLAGRDQGGCLTFCSVQGNPYNK